MDQIKLCFLEFFICEWFIDNLDKLGQPLITLQFKIHFIFKNQVNLQLMMTMQASRMAHMAPKIPSIVVDFGLG